MGPGRCFAFQLDFSRTAMKWEGVGGAGDVEIACQGQEAEGEWEYSESVKSRWIGVI